MKYPPGSSDWLSRCESTVGKVPTLLVLSLLIQITSYLLYPFPPREDLSRMVRYQTMVALCDNPFTAEPIWEPTVRHRILVPFLAWVLGLRGAGYIVLIFLGTYLLIILTLLLLRQSLPLKTAALTTLLLATTLAVITSQSWLTVQDCWANMAMVCCMLCGRLPWTVGPLLLIGMLADERCAAMLPLVFLWFHWHDPPESRRGRLKHRLISVFAAGVVYAGIYFGLHQLDAPKESYMFYGHASQRDFVASILQGEVLINQVMYIPAGLWFGLRAAWLLPLCLWWSKRRERWFRAWLLGGIAVAIGHGLLVEDMSRMAMMAFPAVLLAVVILYQVRPLFTKLLLTMCLLVNLLSPQFQVCQAQCSVMIPLPLHLLRMIQMDHITK